MQVLIATAVTFDPCSAGKPGTILYLKDIKDYKPPSGATWANSMRLDNQENINVGQKRYKINTENVG